MSNMSTDHGNGHSNGNGLAFTNTEECRNWLATQPLASTVQMQSVLQRQMGLLNRAPLKAADRLAVLEELREQIYRTQEECQARFARRPVPLAIPEQAAFDASQATWQNFADGYVRCLEGMLSGEVAVSSRAALIVERILMTLVDMQSDMYRGSQMPPAAHWHAMNQCFAAAEQLEVLNDQVKDKLRSPDGAVTPLSLYVESALLHMSVPTEVNARQMGWLSCWSRRWAKKVVLTASLAEPFKSSPLYVALDQNLPASHDPVESPQLRIFDTTELRVSLRKRLHLLSKGETPASLQMGADCSMPAAGALFEKVYQRWCKNTTAARKHERKSREGLCVVVCGFEKAQTLFGTAVDVGNDGADMARLRRERDQMHMIGQVVGDTPKAPPPAASSGEEWRILDQSASGLRMVRAFARGQQRVAIGMLLAVCFNPESKDYLLASVRWTLVREDSSVEIGIQVLPGAPEPVLMSGKGGGSKATARDRALLLPAVPALKESSSLVIPHGWFEAGRMIEINHGSKHSVRLGQPIERGKDFDRVTFSEASAEAAA